MVISSTGNVYIDSGIVIGLVLIPALLINWYVEYNWQKWWKQIQKAEQERRQVNNGKGK